MKYYKYNIFYDAGIGKCNTINLFGHCWQEADNTMLVYNMRIKINAYILQIFVVCLEAKHYLIFMNRTEGKYIEDETF